MLRRGAAQGAFDRLGLASSRDEVWQILAAVLKLSNLHFTETLNLDATPSCTITNEHGTALAKNTNAVNQKDNLTELGELCGLLGLDVAVMTLALTSRNVDGNPRPRSRHSPQFTHVPSTASTPSSSIVRVDLSGLPPSPTPT